MARARDRARVGCSAVTDPQCRFSSERVAPNRGCSAGADDRAVIAWRLVEGVVLDRGRPVHETALHTAETRADRIAFDEQAVDAESTNLVRRARHLIVVHVDGAGAVEEEPVGIGFEGVVVRVEVGLVAGGDPAVCPIEKSIVVALHGDAVDDDLRVTDGSAHTGDGESGDTRVVRADDDGSRDETHHIRSFALDERRRRAVWPGAPVRCITNELLPGLERDGECLAVGCVVRTLLSLIHISEPTRLLSISYAVFCLKKKK